MIYHAQVVGKQSRFAQNAVREIHANATAVYAIEKQGFENRILEFMQKIYPEKYSHTDKSALQALIPRARRIAESISATSQQALNLLVTLMYGFGHGCDDDPLYPWIGKTLRNEKSINDPNKRIDRLFGKTQMYMDHMLKYLDKT